MKVAAPFPSATVEDREGEIRDSLRRLLHVVERFGIRSLGPAPDFPLEDSAGETGLELDFEAEAGGLHRFEGHTVVSVSFDPVGSGVIDRYPSFAVLVKQLPALRHAATAATSVIEPIDAQGRDPLFLPEIALHPFGGGAVVPPGQARDGAVV